jgi:phenylpropionate dioxygenase-like ring-hydroxylating dioxygenase large terminal subunit
MGKKLSRREFARTSVAAGAAAVALPTTLFGTTATPEISAAAAAGAAAASTAATAPFKRVTMPLEVEYGGRMSWGRDLRLEETLTPAGAPTPNYPNGWKEGTTIPAEYYVDEQQYLNDERYLQENFWFMVDHHSRIRKPGDYFVFEFGRGSSVIVLRDQAGEVKAYHNVCRHRGSRLIQHGFDGVRPTEALPDGKPADKILSMSQLGPSGNTPVIRCVYHAWTYDLSGKLVAFPSGMPAGFDAAEYGLHPCHVQTVSGFIWLSLARGAAPEFEPWVRNWRTVADKYGTADLKIATRLAAPTKANWKLVLENFRECYHCYPAHTKSYSYVHQNYGDPNVSTPEQRARIDAELAKWDGKRLDRTVDRDSNAGNNAYRAGGDSPTGGPQAGGMGSGSSQGSHMKLGFLTGSMDGKPLAPLLPNRKEWSHYYQGASVGFSTSWLKAYDDHVAVVRFTPRGVDSTDAELFWLQALWGNTYREDRWICENQQFGVLSERYNFGGVGQPYAAQEGGPASIVQWYMREVAGKGRAKITDGDR